MPRWTRTAPSNYASEPGSSHRPQVRLRDEICLWRVSGRPSLATRAVKQQRCGADLGILVTQPPLWVDRCSIFSGHGADELQRFTEGLQAKSDLGIERKVYKLRQLIRLI
jgi:hypothetical protein